MNNKLLELYQITSKHSNYQILPSALKRLLNSKEVQTFSRYEKERLDLLKTHLSFENKKILDIGGNTGYFSFEISDLGAKEIIYIEGNKNHTDFVREAAKVTGKNIKCFNEYLNFSEPPKDAPFDIILLFNVIHHLGDDFGDKNITKEQAKSEMKSAINYFADLTDFLVLQMGFCWKGNTNQLLFENGTKTEMINFIKDATKENWEILTIGIAEVNNHTQKTFYKNLNSENIKRIDALGEFRNRPIFILKKR